MIIYSIPGFSDPFSSISHLFMAVVFFILSFYLIFKGRGNTGRVIGLSIYCFCLIFLSCMSGVYHLLDKGYTARYVLQILDYSAIFTLIAGTITPIHLILFRGLNRWLVLFIVWSLAITGLTFTAVFFKSIPEWLSLSFFLGLGWFGLYTTYSIYKIHNRELVKYIVLGGAFYTIGAIIEFIRFPIIVSGIIGPHEIFHIFVFLGALSHWVLIYKIAGFPISKKIIILVKCFPDGKFEAKATSEHIYFFGTSKQEIKTRALEWVKKEFHDEMKPNLVTFKYFDEERIDVN